MGAGPLKPEIAGALYKKRNSLLDEVLDLLNLRRGEAHDFQGDFILDEIDDREKVIDEIDNEIGVSSHGPH